MLSLGSDATPLSPHEPAYSLQSVASGSDDAYLQAFAQAVADWGHPLFLRFDWDMNQSWAPWGAGNNGNTPAEFVAAWRHVHAIFDRAGATNATWVWCPSVNAASAAAAIQRYYPGPAFVDWTCLTGITPDDEQKYTSNFEELFRAGYATLTRIAPHKPIMIGEVGTYLTGGMMAEWIEDMFDSLPSTFPNVRAVVWANIDDPGSGTPLEEYPDALRAFSLGTDGPAYAPNLFARSGMSPIEPRSGG